MHRAFWNCIFIGSPWWPRLIGSHYDITMTIVATLPCVVRDRHFVCWRLNSSVTCGTVIPRRWTCFSVILRYSHYIGLGNNLLPGGTKPLPKPILTYQIEGILPKGPYLPCVSMAGRALLAGYHHNVFCEQFHKKSSWHPVCKMYSRDYILKLRMHFPEVSELIISSPVHFSVFQMPTGHVSMAWTSLCWRIPPSLIMLISLSCFNCSRWTTGSTMRTRVWWADKCDCLFKSLF